GDAAAAGDVGVADRVGVGDDRADVLGADAQRLGELHGDGGACAADVGGAFDQADGAVRVDAGGGAGLQADVEPEAGGDAAAAVGASERRGVVRVPLRRLRGLDHADSRVDRPVGAARALTGAVSDAEVQRVNLQPLADLVHDRLGGERGVGG